ncbi:MAG TPA: biotin/lipoyl-containing protein [Bryobacteraceae bacterium]|nr:biotin/lipoyl-containing protein [Bryobacteraceae bacterium]
MKLNITIDGKTYEVDVEVAEPEAPGAPSSVSGFHIASAPLRVPAGTPPVAPPESGVNESKVCRSPVSGIVVRVAAQVGQNLQPGDILIVLEAMKMETNITAPTAGKIAALRVNQGDSVQAGQVVVEFES